MKCKEGAVPGESGIGGRCVQGSEGRTSDGRVSKGLAGHRNEMLSQKVCWQQGWGWATDRWERNSLILPGKLEGCWWHTRCWR